MAWSSFLKLQAFKTIDCSLIRVVPLMSCKFCSCRMPGGNTYGIGMRFPFSSMLMVDKSTMAVDLALVPSPGLMDGSNLRHSPRTNCNLAKRRVTVSDQLVIKVLMKRMARKS